MLMGIMDSQSPALHRFRIVPASTAAPDLYFDLSLAPSSFWDHVRSDGGDIRVYKQDGTTQIAREVSGFNAGTKAGSLFFPTGDATAFVVECGSGQPEPAADSTYGKYAAWESAAKLVAHLESDGGDSTENQHNGTVDAGTGFGAGKILTAGDFDGSHLVNFGDFGSWPAEGTISMWFSTDNVTVRSGKYPGLMTTNKTGANACFRVEQENGPEIIFYDGATVRSLGNFAADALYLLTITWNTAENNIAVYVNAVLKSSGAGSFPATLPEFCVGYGFVDPPVVGARYWYGLVDEVRLYARALTADEIAAIYANQSDCEAFWTYPAISGVDATYTITVGDSPLEITPVLAGITADITCSDGTNWDAETGTWTLDPVYADGGTIKTVRFSATSGGVTVAATATVVVFRNWSAMVQDPGNPIIPYNSVTGATGADTPYIRNTQKIGNTYYAITQGWVASANWDKFYLYTSTDLLTWTLYSQTPVLTAGDEGAIILHPSIIKIGSLWHMYYSAQPDWTWTSHTIWLATSPDLINWTKYGALPVYSGNPASTGMASLPNVVLVGDQLRMYYWTVNMVAGQADQEYATSPATDGLTWTYAGTTQRRSAADWDWAASYSRYDPWIIKNAAGYYEAVYTAGFHSPVWNQQLGYSVSADGVTWYDFGAAILTGSGVEGDFNEKFPGDGCLVESDAGIDLYYTGEAASVHTAVGVAHLKAP